MDDLKFIHTGSTMLNLALTGHPLLGWPMGRMSNVIGDKSTGKTLLAIEGSTMLINRPPPGITKPKVTYYEGEAAFDIPYAENLGMPVDRVDFEEGDTIEEVYTCLNRCIEAGRDGQYDGQLFILDSMDSISSTEEMKRKIDDGSYGMEKQKKMGEIFRRLVRPMEEVNMHLMIISQIRENITTLPFAPKWRRSGGKALDFYATHVLWLAEMKKHKRNDWVYGIQVKCKNTKNKVARPYREVEFPIIFEYGVDDIHSMLNFLRYHKDSTLPKSHCVVKGTGGWYQVDDGKMQLEDYIEHIENNPSAYAELVKKTYRAWDWFEQACSVERASKTDLLGNLTPADIELDDE